MPLLDGIPIGDCREPTDDERAALGCPELPPSEGAGCNLAKGVACSYSLSTGEGRSYQDQYLCSNNPERRWWLYRERCGELCVDAGPQVLELDTADCSSRSADTCELEDTTFAYAPSGHTLLSLTLLNLLRECEPFTTDFRVSLELARGCPTRLSTTYEFTPEALACIRDKLESKRYSCGDALPCVDYAEYLEGSARRSGATASRSLGGASEI